MKIGRLLLFLLTLAGASLAQTQPSSPPPVERLRAELNRSTTGRLLDDRGLATGTMPLRKGDVYNVDEQKVGSVILIVSGKKVAVPSGEVTVSKGQVAAPSGPQPPQLQPVNNGLPQEPARTPVTPGAIELVSAKYTLMGNQPRNVKTKLAKLIPEGVIDKTVNVLVTDELSTAAAAQGNYTVIYSTQRRIVQEHPKNILTVEYIFNGQTHTRQVMEDTYLTLP